MSQQEDIVETLTGWIQTGTAGERPTHDMVTAREEIVRLRAERDGFCAAAGHQMERADAAEEAAATLEQVKARGLGICETHGHYLRACPECVVSQREWELAHERDAAVTRADAAERERDEQRKKLDLTIMQLNVARVARDDYMGRAEAAEAEIARLQARLRTTAEELEAERSRLAQAWVAIREAGGRADAAEAQIAQMRAAEGGGPCST